jgi:hypothetical protein
VAVKRTLVKARKPGGLSASEQITVATLLAKNATIPEIAEQLQVSCQTIRERCREAKLLLEAASLGAVKDWVRAAEVGAEKGYHQPAKELLEASGVIQTRGERTAAAQGTPTVNVQIGFAVSGLKEAAASARERPPDVVVTKG